jgi:hypothetical protein
MQENFGLEEENFSFWKNLFLVVVFFTITPLTLVTSLFSLLSLSKSGSLEKANTQVAAAVEAPRSGVKVFASLPINLPEISGEVSSADGRSEMVRQYLAFYNSPLTPYSGFIVETADKYELDYRLITAIAQKESNLCKIIPPESYNCWGWGIHSQGSLGFSSFEEGIEEVSRGLRKEYLDKGYETIEDIMSKYTPLSNGSWAEGVNKFMGEMQ